MQLEDIWKKQSYKERIVLQYELEGNLRGFPMFKAFITQRQEVNQYGDSIDSLEASYAEYFSQYVNIVPVSNYAPIPDIQFNAIIITGGGILADDAYDYRVQGRQQVNRDKIERNLFKIAVRKHIPIIGICRGMQQINYFCGGVMSSKDSCTTPRIVREEHRVRTKDKKFLVNHYHTDVIYMKNLAQSLNPIAIDPDNNTVEVFSGDNILGVQWHPERESSKEATEFVDIQIRELLGR